MREAVSLFVYMQFVVCRDLVNSPFCQLHVPASPAAIVPVERTRKLFTDSGFKFSIDSKSSLRKNRSDGDEMYFKHFPLGISTSFGATGGTRGG